MRKIIWMMSVPVDGYMEGPNREIEWHMVDDELFRHLHGWLAGARRIPRRRVTCELMARFWPTAGQGPAATPTVIEFAQIWRDIPRVICSHTLERADWNATVVHDVPPAEVPALKGPAGWRSRPRRRRPGRGVRPPRPD